MKLTDLEPTFLKIEDEHTYLRHDDIGQADGIQFLCPACFIVNGGKVGTHSCICWQPRVPQTISPKPGRWQLGGSGYGDLTLTGDPSSSVLLTTAACHAHFHITAGEIVGLTYTKPGQP